MYIVLDTCGVILWFVAALNILNWSLMRTEAASIMHQIYLAQLFNTSAVLFGLGALCFGLGALMTKRRTSESV